MAIQTLTLNVNAQPSAEDRAFLYLSQNENGRDIRFRVLGDDLPSGCTATLSGVKPDGNVFYLLGYNTYESTVEYCQSQITAGTPVTFVYPLATPLTYNLTPTEVKSLLGINNIWSDAGDVEVEYRADAKLYIDKRLAEVTA